MDLEKEYQQYVPNIYITDEDVMGKQNFNELITLYGDYKKAKEVYLKEYNTMSHMFYRDEIYFKHEVYKLLVLNNYDFDCVYNIIKYDIFKIQDRRIRNYEIKVLINVFKSLIDNESLCSYCNRKRKVKENDNSWYKRKIGIYCIYNKERKYFYIGQAIDIQQRWKQHISELKNNRHTNKNLQEDWNKYGEEKFKFTIVELVENKKNSLHKTNEMYKILAIKEREWIDKIKNKSYNIGFPINHIEYVKSQLGNDFNYSNYYDINKLLKILAKGKSDKDKNLFIKNMKVALNNL